MTIINSNNSNGNVTTTYASSLSGHTVELLSYDLAHTVGAKLTVVTDIQDNKWVINLNSKAGNTISSIMIDYSQFVNAVITNIALDYPNKKIIFYFKDGTTIACDISVLITNLSREIATETARAKAAEEAISSSLNAEITRATQMDTSLQLAINNEVIRAKAAEELLNNTLLAKINELASTTVGLNLRINEETVRAQTKEADLSRLILEEEAARNTADALLTTNLSTEQMARLLEDEALDSKISLEEQSRISADSTLLTQITQVATNLTNEIERATTADSELNIKITTEATTRKNKDDELASIIETESSRAKTVETELATAIETESTARITKDTELSERIDSLSTKGRFLSVWDCTTGYPKTVPSVTKYDYHTGDYYIVGATSATKNYKPYGTYFIRGTASTVEELETVHVNDSYVYDGTEHWTLISTPVKEYTFIEIAGDARDNTSIAGYFDLEAAAREEALETAKTYTDSIAIITLDNAKDYAYNYTTNFTYSQADINDKDLATLNASKAYTYATSVIDYKDTLVLTTAKDYTDTEVAKAGKIDDVKVNNTSVVTDKVANILLKTVNNNLITGEGNIQIDAVTDYDKLSDIPIINTDITNLSNPVPNTYYRHTGDTTAEYAKGLIYQCLDLTPTFSKLALTSELNSAITVLTTDLDNEIIAREEADTQLQTTIDSKQSKLVQGVNIHINQETNEISADNTTDYDLLLTNKPIINADLYSDVLSPEINTYYRHTGLNEKELYRAFILNDTLNTIYFDTSILPDLSAFSAQTQSTAGHTLLASSAAKLTVYNLYYIKYEAAYRDQYAIIAELNNYPYTKTVVYSTKEFSTSQYSGVVGWQNLIDNSYYTFESVSDIATLSDNTSWNGIWAFKLEILSGFSTGNIYKCIQIEPTVTYSSIDRLNAGDGISIDEVTNTISCSLITYETKYIVED